MKRNMLIPAAILAASVALPMAAFAEPADPVACETANAAVLIKAVAVVQASEELDASDATINDALLADVKAAGKRVDAAVKAIQALDPTAPIPPALSDELAAAQAELQTATKLLNDAASSPALSAALDEAKAALASAVAVQLKACAEATPTPTPNTTPPASVVPAPTDDTGSDTGNINPGSSPLPRGGVATGDGSLAG